MAGAVWLAAGAIVIGLIAISPATILFAMNRAAARNGRVSRKLLLALLDLFLLLELFVVPGRNSEGRLWAILGVFWFGFVALWLAASILFASKTTGARNARVAREGLLVWLIVLAVSVIFALPGGMEAWLTTGARLFVSEAAARRIGVAGLLAVCNSAIGLCWFYLVRGGYVMRPVFMCPLKADAGEIQRRVDELWDKPPGGRVPLVLAAAVALLYAGAGFYSSWDQARTMAYWEEQHRKEYEQWFRRSVRSGSPEGLSWYLDLGVRVNAAGDNGYTALHIAADEGHANVAEFLLANGADVNATSKNGYTPLHLAVLEGHRDVVEVLLAHGADVNPHDWEGKTPLRLALDKGHNEIADLLREHGGTE